MAMAAWRTIPSSYRDPAGFMISHEGLFKRAVTADGEDDFRLYMESGLHQELVRDGLVLDFVEEPVPADCGWKRLLCPQQLQFVSYPYEWSFDQLKDAALLTLRIQEKALRRGLSLKDGTVYNVQFRGARPVFIDTLSFERDRGGPWIAYEQFCRQFFAPLALMSYGNAEATKYLKTDLEGFSLEQVSRSLPMRSYLRPGPLLHIHLHARMLSNRGAEARAKSSTTAGFQTSLVNSLAGAVEKLRPPYYSGTWTDYYRQSRFYHAGAIDSKREAVRRLTTHLEPSLVFDLGTNTGLFAEDITEAGADCIAFDSDPGCINRLYLEQRRRGASKVLPLVMDFTNPSPPLGFGLKGMLSFFDRAQADLVLCLALVHHLRFTGNLPLSHIAEFLTRLGRWLVIEFVPRDDPAVTHLLHGRPGFGDYTPEAFLDVFSRNYRLHRSEKIANSSREVFLFERYT